MISGIDRSMFLRGSVEVFVESIEFSFLNFPIAIFVGLLDELVKIRITDASSLIPHDVFEQFSSLVTIETAVLIGVILAVYFCQAPGKGAFLVGKLFVEVFGAILIVTFSAIFLISGSTAAHSKI
jgi:hypothetical protein